MKWLPVKRKDQEIAYVFFFQNYCVTGLQMSQPWAGGSSLTYPASSTITVLDPLSQGTSYPSSIIQRKHLLSWEASFDSRILDQGPLLYVLLVIYSFLTLPFIIHELAQLHV